MAGNESGNCEGLATALFRIDGSLGMARFYVLSVSDTFLACPALVRCWGRIGTAGRVRVDLYSTHGEAEVAKARLLAAKLRKGYRPGGSKPAGPVAMPVGKPCAGQRKLPFQDAGSPRDRRPVARVLRPR